jgi:predicted nucleotide-binding protein
MTTPIDGEWMRAEDALALLGLPQDDAIRTICTRAYARLINARAKRYIDGTGRASDDVELPSEFWWARLVVGDWRIGDFETTESDSRGGRLPGRLQAFGVTFRRSDIEQMISPVPQSAGGASLKARPPIASRKVFIVHGRDEGAKNEVALFLQRIRLEDIVLHQRPNRGRHLLTKFQEEAEGASFAIILMTPDDDGGPVGEPQQRRARQNVVFELGFFIGKFGTPRVAALIVPGVEKPSDFDGICWINFGRGTNWKTELARELKDAGVPFDSDAILRA